MDVSVVASEAASEAELPASASPPLLLLLLLLLLRRGRPGVLRRNVGVGDPGMVGRADLRRRRGRRNRTAAIDRATGQRLALQPARAVVRVGVAHPALALVAACADRRESKGYERHQGAGSEQSEGRAGSRAHRWGGSYGRKRAEKLVQDVTYTTFQARACPAQAPRRCFLASTAAPKRRTYCAALANEKSSER